MKKVLVIDGSGEPLNFCSWKRAFAMLSTGRGKVLELESGEAGDPSFPAVIHLKRKVADFAPPRLVPGRRNIFHRDGYACLYCGAHGEGVHLTLDHVVPRCDGGKNTWENLATACFACNQKKGCRSLEESGMVLKSIPVRPLQAIAFRADLYISVGQGHASWAKFFAGVST